MCLVSVAAAVVAVAATVVVVSGISEEQSKAVPSYPMGLAGPGPGPPSLRGPRNSRCVNFFHQMSDFKAKMHQIRFRLGLAGGAYSAPPDPLAGFNGPTSKGRGGERKGEGREGRERGGRAPSARRAQGPQNSLRRLWSKVKIG